MPEASKLTTESPVPADLKQKVAAALAGVLEDISKEDRTKVVAGRVSASGGHNFKPAAKWQVDANGLPVNFRVDAEEATHIAMKSGGKVIGLEVRGESSLIKDQKVQEDAMKNIPSESRERFYEATRLAEDITRNSNTTERPSIPRIVKELMAEVLPNAGKCDGNYQINGQSVLQNFQPGQSIYLDGSMVTRSSGFVNGRGSSESAEVSTGIFIHTDDLESVKAKLEAIAKSPTVGVSSSQPEIQGYTPAPKTKEL